MAASYKKLFKLLIDREMYDDHNLSEYMPSAHHFRQPEKKHKQ